jgi:hypothetical protein
MFGRAWKLRGAISSVTPMEGYHQVMTVLNNPAQVDKVNNPQ